MLRHLCIAFSLPYPFLSHTSLFTGNYHYSFIMCKGSLGLFKVASASKSRVYPKANSPTHLAIFKNSEHQSQSQTETTQNVLCILLLSSWGKAWVREGKIGTNQRRNKRSDDPTNSGEHGAGSHSNIPAGNKTVTFT